jgi:regulator of protease activity HflC (stomatin/prohibitin superfamily)
MNAPRTKSTERAISTPSGWLMLFVVLAIFFGDLFWLFLTVSSRSPAVWQVIVSVLTLPLLGIMSKGFFTLQPNEASVLLLFGDYRGTERGAGFHWTNPFYTRRRVSLRSRNLNT